MVTPHPQSLLQGGDPSAPTQEDEYKSFLASLGGAPPRAPGGATGSTPNHAGLGAFWCLDLRNAQPVRWQQCGCSLGQQTLLSHVMTTAQHLWLLWHEVLL